MPDGIRFRQELARKAIHLLSVFLGIAVFLFDGDILVRIFIGLGLLLPTLDFGRLHTQLFRKIFEFFFGYVARPHERGAITGASYVFIAAAIVVVLFDTTAAGTGLLFMSIGDSFAAIFGEKYGKTKIGRKSLEGTLAFIISCILIVVFVPGLNLYIGIFVAVLAALIELIPIRPFNDNLVIPIVSAFLIQILGG
ncbi:MAG: hypothetical protein H8D46_03125 [FCB group bacterium]|nr:hypothetical protein [FCB group bacterium]